MAAVAIWLGWWPVALTIVLAGLGNEVHAWSHQPHPGRFVRVLQDAGVDAPLTSIDLGGLNYETPTTRFKLGTRTHTVLTAERKPPASARLQGHFEPQTQVGAPRPPNEAEMNGVISPKRRGDLP